MSPLSKQASEKNGQYSELRKKVNQVASQAIRTAAASSKTSKSSTSKSSKPKK